jgi:hypothetical protein
MTGTIPKWMQRMMDIGVAPEVIEERANRRRMKEREWAQRNRDIKAAHKRAYRAKKNQTLETVSGSAGVAIKYTYRPNWKEAPVYQCTELNYRGKQIS